MKNSSSRNPIIDAMARALFVSAYADYVDQSPDTHLPYASMGQDWMDVAPPTPQYVLDAANQLLGRIEELNKTNIWSLLWLAARADEVLGVEGSVHDLPAKYVSDFGHYLAMQSLGHGVSWWDDHEKFPMELPHIEFMYEVEESA